MNIDSGIYNKKFFLVVGVFLFYSAVGMDNKHEIIFIAQDTNKKNNSNDNVTKKNNSPKNNAYLGFEQNYFTSIKKKEKDNNSEDSKKRRESNSSIDLNLSDLNFSDLPSQKDLPSEKKDIKIENFEQLSLVVSKLQSKLENIENTMQAQFNDLANIFYKFLVDFNKTQQSMEAKIDNISDYLNAVSTRAETYNKIVSNKMQGFTHSLEAVSQCLNLLSKSTTPSNKDLKKISRYNKKKEESSDSEKNKKISPDKKIKRNKKSRFSIKQNGNNFSLDDNGRNSPNEYDEIESRETTNPTTKSTVNDDIGGLLYKQSRSAENINNQRKSLAIRRKNSENFDKKLGNNQYIGVITPQKVNKKNSKESISSKESSLTTNCANSEYPDENDEKSSNDGLRTSSENNISNQD